VSSTPHTNCGVLCLDTVFAALIIIYEKDSCFLLSSVVGLSNPFFVIINGLGRAPALLKSIYESKGEIDREREKQKCAPLWISG
jgi:hypothetical protein